MGMRFYISGKFMPAGLIVGASCWCLPKLELLCWVHLIHNSYIPAWAHEEFKKSPNFHNFQCMKRKECSTLTDCDILQITLTTVRWTQEDTVLILRRWRVSNPRTNCSSSIWFLYDDVSHFCSIKYNFNVWTVRCMSTLGVPKPHVSLRTINK